LFCWGGPAPDNPLQQMLAISQEIFVSKLPSVSMNLAETLSRSNKQSYNYQKNKTDSFFLKKRISYTIIIQRSVNMHWIPFDAVIWHSFIHNVIST
jgi:uncharacterized circularly permuted ATP-grasp superfamily protein